MALTILEASKLNPGTAVKDAVIELYAKTSPILAVLPFENIEGNSLKYNQEHTLPGIGFRGVNEGYTESTGILNPQVEPLVICGGDVDVDNFIIDTMGVDQRTTHEMMKIKSLAQRWTLAFIKGDSTANSREFDGLQIRIQGRQKLAAGNTSGGDALSLKKLDELIDLVANPTHLFMTKALRRILTAAARSVGVAGTITYDVDAFGRKITKYCDLPILVVDEDDQYVAPVGFNEANPGGGSNVGTSIYCVSLGEGMLTGIQNGDVDVRDLGELESKPVQRTRIEWYAGIACYHPRAAARLWGIKNADGVA